MGFAKVFGLVAASVLIIGGQALAQTSPPSGVYSCYDARMAPNAPGCIRSSMGCYGLVITPTPVAMFGLIDGFTYANYDGQQGHYRWDPGRGELDMLDGPRAGWRYHRVDSWAFKLIDNQSGKEMYTCPLETRKDPHKGPW